MATFRDKVVSVTLTYGATSISETQFDIPLILTGHNVTGNLVDYFTSSDALLQAGFGTADPAYKMANYYLTVCSHQNKLSSVSVMFLKQL